MSEETSLDTIRAVIGENDGFDVDTREHESSVESEGSIPERRVNNETLSLIRQPISKYESTPLDFQMCKSVALILQAQGYKVTQEFLDFLTELALIYFHRISENLKTFTELQRRTIPSITDLKYSFEIHKMNYNYLYLQYIRNQKIQERYRARISRINNESLSIIKGLKQITYDKASEAFFDTEVYEITEIVPRKTKKPQYVPSYLPEFPPDYTYQNTARYIEPLRDMEKLRLKLVEESRLTEKSLYNIIEDDENKWKQELELDHEDEIIEEPLSESPSPRFEAAKPPELPEYAEDEDEDVVRIPKPKPIEKRFDFVEYSRKRIAIKKRREHELEQRRKKRQTNIFMKAERYFSPYSTMVATDEIQQEFKGILKHELSHVLRAVRAGEQRQKVEIEEMLIQKAKQLKEKEKERETIQFGFEFNENNHFGSDSDSDEIDENEVIFATDGVGNGANGANGTEHGTKEIKEDNSNVGTPNIGTPDNFDHLNNLDHPNGHDNLNGLNNLNGNVNEDPSDMSDIDLENELENVMAHD